MRKLKMEKDKILSAAKQKLSGRDFQKLKDLEAEMDSLTKHSSNTDDSLKDVKAEIYELSKQKLTATQKKRLKDIEEEIVPLEFFLANAAFHRSQIKLAICMQ